jgi:hypothetical protein
MKGQILAREQTVLAEGFLTEIGDASAAEGGRALVEQELIVAVAAVEGQAYRDLAAVDEGLAGGLIGGHANQRDATRRRLDGGFSQEGRVNLFEKFQNARGLERGTIEAMLELGGELSIERLEA